MNFNDIPFVSFKNLGLVDLGFEVSMSKKILLKVTRYFCYVIQKSYFLVLIKEFHDKGRCHKHPRGGGAPILRPSGAGR